MKAQEFWIDDILNVDRPNQKTAYIYFEDTEKFNGRAIHVREVLEYHTDDEAMVTKCQRLVFEKGINGIVVELERTKKALAKAKQVFSENNNIHVLREIEAIEKGES